MRSGSDAQPLLLRFAFNRSLAGPAPAIVFRAAWTADLHSGSFLSDPKQHLLREREREREIGVGGQTMDWYTL